MLHVQIIMYIALYSVSVSKCRISRWIQPPEQRPLNFQQRSQKIVYFFVFFTKRCVQFLTMFKKNISPYILYIIICSWIFLLLEPKIQQSVKTNSKLAGKPIFSSNIVLYCIMYVILNEFIRTHTTHTEIFKPLLLKFPKTWMVNLAPLCKWWPHCGPCF